MFTVQDNYTAPTEPTLSTTFTKFGVQDFVVEYRTGSGWAEVPGASVISNTRVWRQFNFVPLTTSRIWVLVTRALASRSRLVEVEAYAVWGTVNQMPSVTLTGPTTGGTFPVSSVVTLEAMASDVDGVVSQVEFLVNGAGVGSDTSGSAWRLHVDMDVADPWHLHCDCEGDRRWRSDADVESGDDPTDVPGRSGQRRPGRQRRTSGGLDDG